MPTHCNYKTAISVRCAGFRYITCGGRDMIADDYFMLGKVVRVGNGKPEQWWDLLYTQGRKEAGRRHFDG